MPTIVIGRGISYEFPNGRELFKDLNFSLDSRLAALVGPNGVGKSSLAKLIAGQLEPSAGAIRSTSSVKLLPQRQEPKHVTVTEFLCDYQWSLLGERLLANIDRQSLCTTLSGGQWMRVRLACALDAQFLILDEPTNDLDREGREAIMQFLRERERLRAALELAKRDRDSAMAGRKRERGKKSATAAAQSPQRAAAHPRFCWGPASAARRPQAVSSMPWL